MNTMRMFFFMPAMAGLVLAAERPVPSVPYTPGPITDSAGNEWLLEQNGTLQRGSAPAMIGNCMTLQIASQQFYTQQALCTPDGREIVMTAPQAMGGIRISRHVHVLEREAALLYVEELQNTTQRDLVFTFELRHHLNNQARDITSNLGRPLKDGLERREAGILALPSEGDKGSPAFLHMLRADDTRGSIPPRARIQNKYQISLPTSVTIPAGETRVFVHAIAQPRLKDKPSPEEITRACAPYALEKLARHLPKRMLKQAVNLGTAADATGLAEWFPPQFWGLTPTGSDQLAMGAGSTLSGQVAWQVLRLHRQGAGVVEVPIKEIAALAGPIFTQDGSSWAWLWDGQRWQGRMEAEGLRFTLNHGLEIPLERLDRLVRARPAPPPAEDQTRAGAGPVQPAHILVELDSGERLAIAAEGALSVETTWGPLRVSWADVVSMQEARAGDFGSLLRLRDGTRLRVLLSGRLALKTLRLGTLEVPAASLRRIITPHAASLPEEVDEPAVSFLDLAGGQRLVARVTAASLTLHTTAGPAPLVPTALRQLRLLEDADSAPFPPVFQAHLWGGGTVRGTLGEAALRVDGAGFSWQIASHQIQRLANPVPVADPALLRRIAGLVQDLGNESWTTREAATTALRELGPLARSSLLEARKTSQDAEVQRRLEELLQDEE